MNQIIECVPNFSEGRDLAIIKEISRAIESVDGIKILDIAPGKSTNRTVMTFAGEPRNVIEAAFRGIKKALEHINMKNHSGAHPRFGATDVCPLVPVSNITMDETIEYAHELAQRTGNELEIPVYCYEFAAFKEKRKNLTNCRTGGYETLEERLLTEDGIPDFGPREWSEKVAQSGAVAIGARNFLAAFNINLETPSTRIANAIASEVRESGRPMRKGDPLTGKIVTDENSQPIRIPGTLKKTKAMGWYIEEYKMAQISMNLTDLTVTPLHVAFEEVSSRALEHETRVTGSELIGLIPMQSMLDAGKYFLRKQKRSSGIPDREIIEYAIQSMGLDELAPFEAERKILEYRIFPETEKSTANKTATDLINAVTSASPQFRGGAIAAMVGALGAAIGTMAANLQTEKTGDENRKKFTEWAEKCKTYASTLIHSMDKENKVYEKLIKASSFYRDSEMPNDRDNNILQKAGKDSMEISLEIMELTYNSMGIIQAIIETGSPVTATDEAMAALCARIAAEGAFLYLKKDAARYIDKTYVADMLSKADNLFLSVIEKERIILRIAERSTR